MLPIGFEGQLGDNVELQSAYLLEVGEKSSLVGQLPAEELRPESDLVGHRHPGRAPTSLEWPLGVPDA